MSMLSIEQVHNEMKFYGPSWVVMGRQNYSTDEHNWKGTQVGRWAALIGEPGSFMEVNWSAMELTGLEWRTGLFVCYLFILKSLAGEILVHLLTNSPKSRAAATVRTVSSCLSCLKGS